MQKRALVPVQKKGRKIASGKLVRYIRGEKGEKARESHAETMEIRRRAGI